MKKVNLYNYYKNKVIEKMISIFNYKSVMEVPLINKITLNMGIGDISSNKKILDLSINNLKNISGQKPKITKSKKSISNFKIRKGFIVGCKVTLRKFKMWSFLEKLVYIAIPRIRDFRGLSVKSFDKFGNYNIGIKEQIIFPEINYEKSDDIKGMDINISIKSKNKEESLKLLKLLKFPF